MTSTFPEELLRAIDPANEDQFDDGVMDALWLQIRDRIDEPSVRAHSRSRLYWGASLSGVVAVAMTLVIALSGMPTSALAATLKAAASQSAPQAAFPPLGPGQYYFQQSTISLTCQVSSPAMSPGEAPLTYVADGTMQSWTAGDGSGRVVITPTPVDAGGSHFISPSDEARWITLGRPFIPCALSDSSNQLGGNPTNNNSASSYGGYASTVSGYSGFGMTLASSPQKTLVSSSANVNNLPQSPAGILALLAAGRLGVDGTVNAASGACPISDGTNTSSVGCSPSEQLAILEQLLQLPDASAKLGSALYQVTENLPGVTLVGPVALSSGATGTAVQVSLNPNETFQVVLNPSTGDLVSCAELVTTKGVTTKVGSIDYGPVVIAKGQGIVPSHSG